MGLRGKYVGNTDGIGDVGGCIGGVGSIKRRERVKSRAGSTG
jgi:hypothetical protein